VCSLAKQQNGVKQKMASSAATLQKRFAELKKESGTGTATGTGRGAVGPGGLRCPRW